MKTIMSVDEKHIRRVTDEQAAELYHDGGWRYVPKSLWKEKIRDINKKEESKSKKSKSSK